MRILSILSIAIVALLAFAGALQAQIAAPRLNPAFTPTIFNPAVLPWGGPSRVGAGLLDLEVTDNATGITIGEGDAFAAHVRLVGENFAFQVEHLSVSIDVTPAAGGGFSDLEETMIAGAFQGGEVFSIGIAQESEEESDPGGSQKESLPILGVTLRIGETLFIGAASGTETVTQSAGELERSVTRFGVGLHSRENDGGYHLEGFVENRDYVNNPAIASSLEQEELVGLTAEVIFGGGWLLGLEIQNTDKSDPGSFIGTEEEQIISVGWAPGEGLAVVLSVIENVEKPSGGGGNTFEVTALSVAWMF